MDPMGHNCGECTHRGGKCVRQEQTEDERQRILQELAKQDAGIEGKQQMELTRSPMPTPLPDPFLHEPARIAVKALLEQRIHLPTLALFRRDSLSQDARLLLDRCQDLQEVLRQPPSCTELEGYALSLLSILVESYARAIVPNLDYATRLKLSIIVWHFQAPSCKPSAGHVASHFDASSCEPSHGLVTFLRSPLNKEVWEVLHIRYQKMCQPVHFDAFMRSFDFLLSWQLPREPLASQPEFGGSQFQLQPSRTLVNRKFRSEPLLRQSQFLMPINYLSSPSSHHPQTFGTATSHEDRGRSYPFQVYGQRLGPPAGGRDRHHADSFAQLQRTTPLPLSHMSLHIPRESAVTRSDPPTVTLHPRLLPYHIDSYRESGKTGARPQRPVHFYFDTPKNPTSLEKKRHRYD